MARVKALSAREILDSRGLPTVEAEAFLSDGSRGRAAVPSGASTGVHEALERRDGDPRRFGGKGVLKAVAAVDGELSRFLKGRDAEDQAGIDAGMCSLDGTPNKGRLGANAILAASLAVSRAAAASRGLPLYRWLRKAYGLDEKEWLLPAPMFNVVNGGAHADSGLDVQEFMVVPVGSRSFKEALRAGSEIYHVLKKTLAAKSLAVSVGDEGGFAPRIKAHAEVLGILEQTIRKAGYGGKARISLDVAASEFFGKGGGKPDYRFEGRRRSSAEMARIYRSWISRYKLLSIEDPMAEDDWAGWTSLTAAVGSKVRVVGDDLFVTNPDRLDRGIREKAGNSILIKLNQIGSVSETVETVLKARKAGFSSIISHRSGETEDPYIADLAVALNAGAIKTGAPCRSERLAKYNQLLRIESELGRDASYAGGRSFSR